MTKGRNPKESTELGRLIATLGVRWQYRKCPLADSWLALYEDFRPLDSRHRLRYDVWEAG